MSTRFWADPALEPKRGFRFLVYVNSIPSFLVKKCSKPELTIKNVQHKYLNHQFNFPAGAEWSPVTMEMVDPVDPDASKTLQHIIQNSGYHFPRNPDDVTTLSKAGAVAALGKVAIDQIDDTGRPVERWVLKNAWVEKVSYGELAYDSEDLTTITLTIRYDWAEQDQSIGGQIIPAGND
jgi:hypothetical protein